MCRRVAAGPSASAVSPTATAASNRFTAASRPSTRSVEPSGVRVSSRFRASLFAAESPAVNVSDSGARVTSIAATRNRTGAGRPFSAAAPSIRETASRDRRRWSPIWLADVSTRRTTSQGPGARSTPAARSPMAAIVRAGPPAGPILPLVSVAWVNDTSTVGCPPMTAVALIAMPAVTARATVRPEVVEEGHLMEWLPVKIAIFKFDKIGARTPSESIGTPRTIRQRRYPWIQGRSWRVLPRGRYWGSARPRQRHSGPNTTMPVEAGRSNFL